MTRVNLLWPRWAELAAHLRWRTAEDRGFRCQWLIRKTGALLANRYGRAQAASSMRRQWEALYATPPTRELWARPRRLPRGLFLALAIAAVLRLSELSATAAPNDESAAAVSDETTTDDGGRLFKALGWATFAGSAGDLASTQYALSRGAVELNPLQQNGGVRIGSAVAFPLASNYLTDELRENGHPKLALWLRVAVVALKGYAIVHNLREAP